jgi:hypothetical protein
MTDQTWWLDPDYAWWAKADCAKGHIDTLGGQVDDFLRTGSYEVLPEQGSPGETIYRLRMSRRVPTHFSTTLGDALHDLRSALDCAAAETARRYVKRDLEEDEERACAFPICSKPSELRKFFQDEPRPSLFGPSQQQAIREVQPAALHDDLAAQGRSDLHERSEEVEYDHLAVLQRLSNIDKHRRLHVVTFWPDLIYWGSDGPSRRRWQWGAPPFKDGAILGRLLDDPEDPEPLPKLYHEIELRLTDPPGAATADVIRLLEGMHRHVTCQVLPHVLASS